MTRRIAFLAIVGVIAGLGLIVGRDPTSRPRVQEGGDVVPIVPGPTWDIQKDGPLVEGKLVTLDEARKEIPYWVPDPPVDALTGNVTGIWIDRSGQIGIVWETDLRLYLDATLQPEQELSQDFAAKAANDDEQVEPWVLGEVVGHTSLGVEGKEKVPSSLSFQTRSVSFQFVGPDHTLAELSSLAEKMIS